MVDSFYIAFNFSFFFFVLQKVDLFLYSSLYFVQLPQVFFYFCDFSLDIIVEVRYLLFEFVKIAKNILGQEGQDIRIVVQVVVLIDMGYVTLWAY